ncbi:MAG TPA: type VI secretion protein IcmF/TssM N-terminal domain-containing protein [Gemmataceae bacterium]|nr:type VI secretion protein IcmF/TssM N-terminal domain-containing protein [Gemmataceae bacterium]
MAVLERIGDLFRWIAGAVVPMFVRPVPPVGLAWFVHVVLVAAIAVGLHLLFVYQLIPLLNRVNVTKGPPLLQRYWLVVLFLLVYALLWAAVRLWALLAPNQPATEFPDLDEAWAKITDALQKAGIGIVDTPLFLVFGQLPAGFDDLFRALPHGLAVAGVTGTGSPLQVFANRDGIYLTLPGASLLGVQGRGGLGTYSTDAAGGSVYHSVGVNQSVGIGASVGASIGASVGGSVGGSVGAGGPLQEIQKIIRKAREANRPLTEDEKRRVRDLSGTAPGGGGAPAADPVSGAVGSVLQNPALVDEASARLTHVCGLVATSRWPLCPVNGAILAVPMTAAEKDETAQQWGLVARQDLAVAEAAVKLRFPVYTLVGGLEDLPGGQVFFERFAADKSGQRLGKGFPLNPEVRPEAVGELVEAAVGWVFNSLLPYWAFKLMRVDAAVSADTQDNAALVRFLSEVRRRGPHLSRLVSRAVVLYGDVIPVFGGCYLTVFLQAEPADAKFAREFFKKVEGSQGAVAWTEEAFAEDAGYRRMTGLGHLALGLLLLGVLAFAGYVAYEKWPK